MLSIEPLSGAALLATVLTLATLLSLLWLRRRGHNAARPQDDEAPDTVQAWPPQAVRVMTLPERKALELLRRALPRNHLVLAQVPLARFISVPTQHAYADWLHKVGRLCPDLLVCDASSRVIGVVEIRPPENSLRSRKRHERVHRVLLAAGIPVHVWSEASMPSVAEARALFTRKSAPADGPDDFVAVGPQGQAMLPLPDIHEMLASGDEGFAVDPLHDPVASGFFDDLDAIGSSGRAARA